MTEEKIIELRGIPVEGGKVEGKALVSRDPIAPTGGMDNYTGEVIEREHDIQGKNVTDKILVFPTGAGSTTGPWRFLIQYKHNCAPKAVLCVNVDGIIATSALITHVPLIHRFDKDLLETIDTGDKVIVNADEGIVKVTKEVK